MASKLETLKANLEAAFGDRLQSITEALGQLTIVVKASNYAEVALQLRDDLFNDHRRETFNRFVEHQQPRMIHQRTADREHLLFAA